MVVVLTLLFWVVVEIVNSVRLIGSVPVGLVAVASNRSESFLEKKFLDKVHNKISNTYGRSEGTIKI